MSKSVTNRFRSLREKHSTLVYRNYQHRLLDTGLEIEFHFTLLPDVDFRPKVTIAGVSQERLSRLPKETLHNLIFHLGLAEIPSYWKAACPAQVRIEAGRLSTEQLAWWRELLIKGLTEFFFLQEIDFTKPDIVELCCVEQYHYLAERAVCRERLIPAVMIPIGGGKDSVVTLETLKRSGYPLSGFILNQIPSAQSVFKESGIEILLSASRLIDPQLLTLNQAGYLNGHTPFSAYLAFLSVLVARLFDQDLVALSNESSANQGNVFFKNQPVNHQWSKTVEFEANFRQYCQAHLTNMVDYFSFLRPLNELQIAGAFAELGRFHPVFKSCNKGIASNSWCANCAKCLFVALILSPFLDDQQLNSIFGREILNDPALLPLAWNLVGEEGNKPFDCVGTYEEVRAAVVLAIAARQKKGVVPPALLLALSAEGRKLYLPAIDESLTLLAQFNAEHFTPEGLIDLVSELSTRGREILNIEP